MANFAQNVRCQLFGDVSMIQGPEILPDVSTKYKFQECFWRSESRVIFRNYLEVQVKS